jgi:hypothetical protein
VCSGLSIEELRKQIKLSNRARTFQKSRELDEILEKRLQSRLENVLRPIIEKLNKDLEESFNEHQSIVAQLEEESHQREQYLREAIDISFSEMKDRQVAKLVELEMQRQSENLREKGRAPASVQELQRMSVSLADRGEYDDAMKIDREASIIMDHEVEERQKIIEQRFAILSKNLFSQFEKEIQLLQDRLKKGIQAILDQLSDETQMQKKQFSMAVQRLLLSGVSQANTEVWQKERQLEINSRLTNFVRKRALSYGMNKNLNFD